MNESGERNPLKKSFSDRLYRASGTFTKIYDRSIIAYFSKKLRNGFLTLSTRVLGIFFLTFGIYSFLIALLLALFTEKSPDLSSLYGGAACAICTLPLLFSKGNISTILTGSALGRVICDYLNIRKETLKKDSFSGHLSIAFVAGVAMGALTVIFPFSSIILAVALVLMAGMIMCMPEAGLTFMAISLFITDEKLQYSLIGVTLLSYIFKLVRSKRQIVLKKTDILLIVFSFATLGAALFVAKDSSREGCAQYILFLTPYLLCVLLLRDARKITKLLTATVISAGTLSALYILGHSVATLIPAGVATDREYILRTVSSLYAFESGFAPLAFTALIPVCVAFIIKPRSEGYRFTLILCLASMVSCLFMEEELAYAAAAFIATALLLLITGSRWVYLSLASFLTVTVSIAFAGSLGDRLYSYIYNHIYEAYHQAESFYAFSDDPIASDYILCGQGFTESSAGSNFFHSLLSQLGIAGALVFAFFILFVIAEATALILKTYRSQKAGEGLDRFANVGNAAETRMGIIAAVCSLFAVLFSATFIDFYTNPLSYLMLFMLAGVCSAYTRSAVGEIEKAKGSLVYQSTKERAAATVSRQYN